MTLCLNSPKLYVKFFVTGFHFIMKSR